MHLVCHSVTFLQKIERAVQSLMYNIHMLRQLLFDQTLKLIQQKKNTETSMVMGLQYGTSLK